MTKLTATTVLLATVLSLQASAQTTPRAGDQNRGAEPAAGTGQRLDQAQAAATIKKLTRAELDALLKDPGRVILLDVHRPDELQSVGGFPAYLSIQTADVEKYLAFIPRDRTIVTVSNHADRVQRTGALLEKNGFKVAGAIGVQDYEGEGGTQVRIAAPAPWAGAAAATGQAPVR
jgi:rhodanese-related sulfurtransferase